jgi:hypothetical protein
MTDWVPWFRYQLKASADGFEWAFSQIPSALHEQLPPEPDYMGTWPPARHVWHVAEYERSVVIPTMGQWLGGAIPPRDIWPDDDESWAGVADRSFDALIAAFRQNRQEQIELLDQLTGADWMTPRQTWFTFAQMSLSMLVTKTFQHTYEHGDTLLRMGLWWH